MFCLVFMTQSHFGTYHRQAGCISNLVRDTGCQESEVESFKRSYNQVRAYQSRHKEASLNTHRYLLSAQLSRHTVILTVRHMVISQCVHQCGKIKK